MASDKLNPSLPAIPQQMVIDKLRTIIGINTQYIKGKPFGDSLQSLQNTPLTSSHHRLGPTQPEMISVRLSE